MTELQFLLDEKLKAQFINPYTDFGFKRLFGVEGNKELLIDFLNQLLPERHLIQDCAFENLENAADIKDERRAIFDIRCRSTRGETFVIEMQKAKLFNFEDRSVYYTSFPIQQQSKKGTWDFKLSPVYLIALLDFDYDEDREKREIVRNVSLIDQNGELFNDSLHFVVVQMTYFKKSEAELVTHLDKWLYFLKNLESFTEIPTILNEPIFQKAFQTARVANMNMQEYNEYTSSLMNYLEINAVVQTAKTEGIIEGKKEGIIEGKIEGKKETLSIVKYYIEGLSLPEIALRVDKSVEFVTETIEEAGLKSLKQ